jgi:glycerol uptake operon antiterminator
VLPAACYDVIPEIKTELNAQVLMGGLIRNEEQTLKCFEVGAIAITTSNPELWKLN